VRVPTGSTQVEVWFEDRAPNATTGWDSRYGQNYTFPVSDEGLPIPEPSVELRPGARVDASRINVVEDAASKDQVALGSKGTRLRTALVVRARIGQPSASAIVWADLHVFDATGELIHRRLRRQLTAWIGRLCRLRLVPGLVRVHCGLWARGR
jgi:hypothetical protein